MESAELVVRPEEQSARERNTVQQTETRVREYLQVLEGGGKRRPTAPKLVFESGKHVDLSPKVLRALQFVLHQMGRGRAFALIPEDKMLTTNEAANVLNVSRPFLGQLMSKGEIAFTKVGTHHRLRLADVLEYKKRRDRRMFAALDKLARDGQEAGDYFDD